MHAQQISIGERHLLFCFALYDSEKDIKGLFADFDATSNRLGNTVEAKNKSDAEKTARLMYDDGELFTKDVNGYSSLVGLEGVSEAEVEVEANVVKEENE